MNGGQGEQVLSSVVDSTYCWPFPHLGCVLGQVVVRWAVEVWNVFAEQVEHVRCAVLESTNFSPIPHVGCVLGQVVVR